MAAACLVTAAAPAPAAEERDARFGLFRIGNPSPPDSINANPDLITTTRAGWSNRQITPSTDNPPTDSFVVWMQEMGMEVVLTLANLDPGDTLSHAAADTAAYKQWVGTVVERYDHDGFADAPGLLAPVTHWHVEEEWGATWGGTVEEYLQVLGLASRAIRQVSAEARIILIGLASNTVGAAAACHQLDQPLEDCVLGDEGVLHARTLLQSTLYDVIDMHSYESHPIIPAKVEWIRSVAAKPDAPIWSLEAAGPSGWDGTPYDDAANASAVAQQFAQAFGSGIERYAWAFLPPPPQSRWDAAPWTLMPLTRWESYPDSLVLKPAFYTYELFAAQVGGFSAATNLSTATATDTTGVHLYRFALGDTSVYVAWSPGVAERTVSLAVTGDGATITRIITQAGLTDADAVVAFAPAAAGTVEIAVGPEPVFLRAIDATAGVRADARARDARARDARPRLHASPSVTRGGVRLTLSGAREPAPVPVRIADARGALVREITMAPDAVWDGRTAEGRETPSGLYIASVEAPQRARARIVRIAR